MRTRACVLPGSIAHCPGRIRAALGGGRKSRRTCHRRRFRASDTRPLARRRRGSIRGPVSTCGEQAKNLGWQEMMDRAIVTHELCCLAV